MPEHADNGETLMRFHQPSITGRVFILFTLFSGFMLIAIMSLVDSSHAASEYKLPVPESLEIVVTRGASLHDHGYDLALVDDDPYDDDDKPFTVVAARGGRVLDIQSDSTTRCNDLDMKDDGTYDPGCWTKGNYVLIDHEDTMTAGLYLHLAPNSIVVRPGDRVQQGQPLATAGNTGWSTKLHLHFQVEVLPCSTAAHASYIEGSEEQRQCKQRQGWWWTTALPAPFSDESVLESFSNGMPTRGSFISSNAPPAVQDPQRSPQTGQPAPDFSQPDQPPSARLSQPTPTPGNAEVRIPTVTSPLVVPTLPGPVGIGEIPTPRPTAMPMPTSTPTPEPTATPTPSPTLTPEPVPVEDRVVFTTQDDELVVSNNDGTNALTIATGAIHSAAWSNQGDRVAYIRSFPADDNPDETAWQIEVVSADGSEHSIVVPPHKSLNHPDNGPAAAGLSGWYASLANVHWSPEDTSIFYSYSYGNSSGRYLVSVDPSTLEQRELVYAWSIEDIAHDGMIVYSYYSNTPPTGTYYEELSPNGEIRPFAPEADDPSIYLSIAVSPDGTSFVTPSGNCRGLWLYNRDGTGQRPIGDGWCASRAWWMGGDTLVFDQVDENTGHSVLWTISIHSDDRVELLGTVPGTVLDWWYGEDS